MEIAMLILTIISTAVAVISLIYTFRVKKETKEIKTQLNLILIDNSNNNEENKNIVNTNRGIVANSIKGGIDFNERK